jgi:hypothetical protein
VVSAVDPPWLFVSKMQQVMFGNAQHAAATDAAATDAAVLALY